MVVCIYSITLLNINKQSGRFEDISSSIYLHTLYHHKPMQHPENRLFSLENVSDGFVCKFAFVIDLFFSFVNINKIPREVITSTLQKTLWPS